MTNQEIINHLKKSGCEEVKNLTIRSVTVTPKENVTQIGLNVDKEVNAYLIDKETGEIVLSTSSVIFTNTYQLGGVLRDNEEASFAVNYMIEHPKSFEAIMSKAKIDILQQKVKAEEEYVNPFSSNPTPITFDHDIVINYITNVEIGKLGLKGLDKLFDKILES